MKTKSTPIANIIYPTKNLCLEERLYFKSDNLSWYSYEDSTLYLKEGASVPFDTYFNSFSLGKWQENTTIEDIELYLETEGHLLCTLYHMDEEHVIHTVSINEIKPSQSKITISIPQSLQGGLLYFTLKGLTESQLKTAHWATSQDAENIVKLGLSITTFNRQEAVKASVSRILDFLHKTEIDAHLLVVDNGKNVALEEDSKLTLIPNENLGGSGGFARGLYHLKEENDDFTHCLFMDDDASCETESIFRTYQLLAYAKDERLAVAGSMLLGDKPNIQWENGANFNQHCMPLKSGFNLYDIHQILDNDKSVTFDYGGWWFFAFPIAIAEYPYPFFVRGDDVNFGLQEQFQQITMNGIATWGDDFFAKESPLTQYLDTRSHLLHHLQVPKLNNDYLSIMKVFWRFIIRYAFMYKYASVEAQNEAMKDVLKGPAFFENNIDMKNIFSKIGPLNNQEKMVEVNIDDYKGSEYCPELKWHWPMKTIKLITLNSHLMPSFLLNKKLIILNKNEHRIGAYFRRKEVLLYDSKTRQGFTLQQNKKRFFTLLMESMNLSYKMFKKRKTLTKEYQDKYTYLTSKEYWEKQFFPDKDTI